MNHKRWVGDFLGPSLSLNALSGTFQKPGKGPGVTDKVPKRRERGLTGTATRSMNLAMTVKHPKKLKDFGLDIKNYTIYCNSKTSSEESSKARK
ncbi:hypothetical protein DUI87_07604 [Hirundo rustica rustica]|uniref:Uncharacterized protein n=1 Tax=Hirundo rustica rustica TaxID=333673 RepID=A0A3M0KQM7_HIRRU|nr:hypothetical protein DUI87_07604 [Hirundo rustica rustica]